MQDQAVRKVLLVQAIEEADRAGEALPLAERTEATRTAIGNNPPPAGSEAEAPLSSATEWFLMRRADVLLSSLRMRSPGVDHVLEIAGGASSLDRGMLGLAFLAGAALSLVDGGGGINIFAPPLLALIVWNLLSYVWMLGPGRRRQSAVVASSSGSVAAARPARSWFGDFYARWVRRRIDRLLGHSTRFNAPLASGLRRFIGDWWDIAQPLFYARARRLLHLSAVSLALGLVTAYYLRAFMLRSAAGWDGSRAIGPETAHALLRALYGPASLLSGIRIPPTEEIAKLRWSAPSLAGVGEPAIWVHLIAVTACLYVVLPRLLALCWSTLSLWRLSRQFVLPSSVIGYVRTLFAAAR
jgi:hypothetical protein